MDFLRWAQPNILATLSVLAVVLFAAWFILQQPEIEKDVKQIVRRVRATLVLILLAIFVWQIISAASVNLTPRSVIDRSDVNRQIDKFEKRLQ